MKNVAVWFYSHNASSLPTRAPQSMLPSMCFQGRRLCEKDGTAVWCLTFRHHERCLLWLCHYSYSYRKLRHTHARTHTHSLTGVELHPATAVCTLWRARAAFVNSTNMHKHTHYSLLLEIFNYMNHWEEHRLFKIMPDTPLEQFIYSEYED